MVLVAAWFAALSATRGVWHPVGFWSGIVVRAGLTGLGPALLMLPAPLPRTAAS